MAGGPPSPLAIRPPLALTRVPRSQARPSVPFPHPRAGRVVSSPTAGPEREGRRDAFPRGTRVPRLSGGRSHLLLLLRQGPTTGSAGTEEEDEWEPRCSHCRHHQRERRSRRLCSCLPLTPAVAGPPALTHGTSNMAAEAERRAAPPRQTEIGEGGSHGHAPTQPASRTWAPCVSSSSSSQLALWEGGRRRLFSPHTHTPQGFRVCVVRRRRGATFQGSPSPLCCMRLISPGRAPFCAAPRRKT